MSSLFSSDPWEQRYLQAGLMGHSLADRVMRKFRPLGRRLQTSCQKGVILSQVQSTASVTGITKSVDADIYFPEFSSLPEWSLAEVSRGKVKMSH